MVSTGFGLGLGVGGAQILFMFIGVILFVPGIVMFSKEKKAGEKASTTQIIGVILMGLGSILMFGMGFGLFIGAVQDMV